MWQPIPVLLLGESPRTEEPGGLQSPGRKEVDTTDELSTQHTKAEEVVWLTEYLSSELPAVTDGASVDVFSSVQFSSLTQSCPMLYHCRRDGIRYHKFLRTL